MEKKIEFVHLKQSYTFIVHECKSSSTNQIKQVYIGAFEGRAPEPCEPNVTYCLVTVGYPDSGLDHALQFPVSREFIDLMEFRGRHLRRVIVRDDAALWLLQNYGNRLPNQADLGNHSFSMIEPCYQSSEGYLDGIKNNTRKKLEYFYLALLALKELYNNQVNGVLIAAQRDFKLGNILTDEDGNPVLIDFSTVKLQGLSLDSVKAFFSANNTAAEDVFGAPEEAGASRSVSFDMLPFALQKSFVISEKTDVFSAGGLLAELFSEDGKKNPIHMWSEKHTQTRDNAIRMAHELAQAYLDLLTDHGRLPEAQLKPNADARDGDWLTKETAFPWSEAADEKIRAAVSRMTAVNPVNRPSVDDVLSEVEQWLGLGLSLFVVPRNGLAEYAGRYWEAARVAFFRESFDADKAVGARKTGGCAMKLMHVEGDSLKNEDVTTDYLLKAHFQSLRGMAQTSAEPSEELERILIGLSRKKGLAECGLPERRVKIHLFAPSAFPLTEDGRKAVDCLRRNGAELILHAAGEPNEDWKDCFVPLKPAPAPEWEYDPAPAAREYGPASGYGAIAVGEGELFVRHEGNVYYVSRRGGRQK